MSEDHDPQNAPPAQLLTSPRDGVPEVVADADALHRTVADFASAEGPVAVDAERASGFRYLPRAYLIQMRRNGAGTALIDPTSFTDLADLDAALKSSEWILHAATQDLPCLVQAGLKPRRLFDTELAARLCGFERVGLAALTERLLGYALEKHHSAADWSTRPLPPEWLNYAALDVELLIELREGLEAELRAQGKREWAAEEFAALIDAPPAKPRREPWRRTSGIHRVRGPRGLARVRALWHVRDEIARRMDKAPTKIVPDLALTEAAVADPTDFGELVAIAGFQRRHGRANAKHWLQALAKVRSAPNRELPAAIPPADGPPATHRWAARDPVAAARLKRARAAVSAIAAEHQLPPENLVIPAAVRALAWQPPAEPTVSSVTAALQAEGVRPWQLGLTAQALAEALGDDGDAAETPRLLVSNIGADHPRDRRERR